MVYSLFYLDFNVFIYPEVARRVSIKVVVGLATYYMSETQSPTYGSTIVALVSRL